MENFGWENFWNMENGKFWMGKFLEYGKWKILDGKIFGIYFGKHEIESCVARETANKKTQKSTVFLFLYVLAHHGYSTFSSAPTYDLPYYVP
jgi:hypothetical protein